MRPEALRHEFVGQIPDRLQNGVLYIALEFGTVVHACCCGCGNEVITPIAPTDWKLTFDGESISLYPSIGNWSFACQSHYWIKGSRVFWDRRWSRSEIAAGRRDDRVAKEEFYRREKPHFSSAKNISSRFLRSLWSSLKERR